VEELVKSLGDVWGPPGIIIAILLLVVGYLYRENQKLIAQHEADDTEKEKAHKIEIAQWMKLVLEEKDKQILVAEKSSAELVKSIGTVDQAMRLVAKGVNA